MYLICGFDDQRASQILSEQEGERRDFTPGYLKGGDTAGHPATGLGSVGFEPGVLSRKGGHAWHEAVGCLRADMGDNQAAVAIYDARGNDDGERASTLTGDHEGHVSDYTKVIVEQKTYGICSMESHSMLSDNADCGIHEAVISPTLDTNAGDPCVRQGGIVITEREAVCYQERVGTLAASDYRFPQDQQVREGKVVVEREQQRYSARRLMPKECLLLQGLPVDHLDHIHISDPAEADIDYWYSVWEENRVALGKCSKPRSRRQVAKWIANPYSDTNAYRAIGNSLAVPCALFVMRGIGACR